MVVSKVPSVFLLSSFEMYYIVHYKLHAPISTRGQNTVPLLYTGLERPRGSLWPRSRAQKGGRSSPVRCFARVRILRRAPRNLQLFTTFASRLGDARRAGHSEPCLSRTRHRGQ